MKSRKIQEGKQIREGKPKGKAPLVPAASERVIDLVPAFLQLEKVLVPVDFSGFSLQALQYALPFVEQFGAALVLVHVVEPRIYPVDYLIVPAEMQDANVEMKKRAKEQLEALQRQIASERSISSMAIVRSGKPYQEICAVAKEMDVDLVILATHGYTGLKHIYLGSTAERVIRHAHCPVLTVRERAGGGKSKPERAR